MTASRGDALYELLGHVRPLVLNSARVVEAGLREVGWTVGSRAVVEVLLTGGPATVPQLAAHLDLARQNVQRHVDELRRLGHVRTRPNPNHRRSVLVEPTEEGERAFDRLHAEEVAALADLAPEHDLPEIRRASAVLAALDRDVRTRAADIRES